MINRRLKTTQTTLTEDHTTSWLLRTRLSVEGKCTSPLRLGFPPILLTRHQSANQLFLRHQSPISSCHVTKPASRSC
ncbi:hypothetical protein Pmani_030900 [Petrolisthes manimaculis]|uniref:Uncharacterized protein n=1 Tax=Petrolisthes manimaculis TaxID=1843537 RepID=A0AAE1TSH2_9EUCA|nr:hypothetical protein Pmani_030900 [Petrolisthes manimaculis]